MTDNEEICKGHFDRMQETSYGYQRGKWVGKDKTGVWDQQIQTTVYKIDRQQGPTIYHRELQSVSHKKP